MPQVKRGSTVRVHYTVMLKNGEVVESTAGGDPMRITVGAGKVLAAFEEALLGMSAGETKKVVIPPEKGYGRRSPGTSTHLSLETAAPIGASGKVLQHQVVNRGSKNEYCIEVTDRGLVLDSAPHLADKELVFDIDLVEIENT